MPDKCPACSGSLAVTRLECESCGTEVTGRYAPGRLLNLGEPWGFDISPWARRVVAIDAKYAGNWELPALGQVAAPAAVLIRPDGYVAWVGDGTDSGLPDALTRWFGSP